MRVIVKGVVALTAMLAATAMYTYLARSIGNASVRGAGADAVFAERAVVRIPETGTSVRAEVARTTEDRQQGLSGRRALLPGTGLLLVFDRLDYHGIWMPNMKFSIDVIWIAGGAIIDVTERLPVPPRGETYLPIFRPGTPALSALEVPAGTVAREGIRKGQKVEVQFDGAGQ